MRAHAGAGKQWLWIAAIALAAVLPYALKVAPDSDLWWHLKTGEMILEQRGLPEADPFSFTAAGAPWTNHEWLADVVLAAAYSAGADRALLALRIALLLIATGALARLLWSRLPHPLLVLAGVLLAAPVLRVFMNFRPHAYTYALTLLLLLLLEASRRRPRMLWIAPPLVALWANLHGGFLLGLGILVLGVASHLAGFEDDGPRPDAAARRTLLAPLALAFAAPLVNPYGFGLFGYLARELGADHSLVLEWRGIWAFEEQRPQFRLLLAVPVAAVLLARRVRPAMPAAMLVVAAVGTWTHGRFLVLLAIFSVLVTFSALAEIARHAEWLRDGHILVRLQASRWAWALCALPLLAGALQIASDYRGKGGFRLVVNASMVPLEGGEFLRRHDLGPNLLLRFDWGGYAIWHLYPRYKVSADGRNLTVYDAAFVDRQIRAYHEGRFADYAEQHAADVILSERAGPAYDELRSDGRWVRVHEDGLSAVFVRPEVARTLGRRRTRPATARAASERFYFP
jgi:hypothetical protein